MAFDGEGAYTQDVREDTIQDKLCRLGDVVVLGTLQGIDQTVRQKFSSPEQFFFGTCGQIALGHAAGYALARLQPSLSAKALTRQAIGGSLLVAGIADLAPKAGGLAQVIERTWNSADTQAEDKQKVAEAFGPFAVDSTLFAIGNSTAPFWLAKSGVARGVSANRLDAFFKVNDQSALEQSLVGFGRTRAANGSGFITDITPTKATVATAAHVAFPFGDSVPTTVLDAAGKPLMAKFIAAHPTADVALARLEGIKGAPIAAASLAETSATLKPGDELLAAGRAYFSPRFEAQSFAAHQDSLSMFNQHVRPFDRVTFKLNRLLGISHPERMPTNLAAGRELLMADGNIGPGMSGGPLFNRATGEVVGVNHATMLNLNHYPDLFEPVGRVHELQNLATRAARRGGSIQLETAAKRLQMEPDQVAALVKEGKIEAVLVPPKSPEALARGLETKGRSADWNLQILWDDAAKANMQARGITV